jgi:hypothetical protein
MLSTVGKIDACNTIGLLPVWGFHADADVRRASRRACVRVHPDKTSVPDDGQVMRILHARDRLLSNMRVEQRCSPMDVDLS